MLIAEVTTLPSHSTDVNLGVKETAFNHMFPFSDCPPLTTLHPMKVCKSCSVSLWMMMMMMMMMIMMMIITAVQFAVCILFCLAHFLCICFNIVTVLHRTVALSVGSPFTWILVSLFEAFFHLLPLLPFPVGLARTTLATLYCTHNLP